ncbi:hypothetical protein HUJ04_000425 [Dendroctonus ponderosae]|nr:hypothetical protein HUJ04_000425 [Dendroctonus ponderosae]
MTNLVMSNCIMLNDTPIEQVSSYQYPGHKMKVNRDNQTHELNRRIGLTWAAYGRLKHVFTSKIPVCLKRKVFGQCVLPVLTYGAQALTLTKQYRNKIKIAQRKMERAMLGVSLRDRIANNIKRQRLA